jgi:hypothetical protein
MNKDSTPPLSFQPTTQVVTRSTRHQPPFSSVPPLVAVEFNNFDSRAQLTKIKQNTKKEQEDSGNSKVFCFVFLSCVCLCVVCRVVCRPVFFAN